MYYLIWWLYGLFLIRVLDKSVVNNDVYMHYDVFVMAKCTLETTIVLKTTFVVKFQEVVCVLCHVWIIFELLSLFKSLE